MYPNKSYPLASAASWASGILCASQTANQVGTITGTWRPFATEGLVSPGNDPYSCSLLIRSHVQPLIRFPQAWPGPPRLRHTSPRRCSTLRPSVGSRSAALAGPAWPPTSCCPFSCSGALQSTVFRWDEMKGFDKCKALFTGEMIIPISRASAGYLEIHSPQTRPPPDRTPPTPAANTPIRELAWHARLWWCQLKCLLKFNAETHPPASLPAWKDANRHKNQTDSQSRG